MILDILVVVCILLSLQFLALVGIFVAILVKFSPPAPKLLPPIGCSTHLLRQHDGSITSR